MSEATATPPEQIQVFYEVALSIGQGETVTEVARTALSAYLRRLNCSTGGVFARCERPGGSATYELIAGIPRRPTFNEAFEIATDALPNASDFGAARRAEALPITGEHNGSHYYLFDLPNFGVLVVIKNGAPFSTGTLAALTPLHERLADACTGRRAEQEARRTRETLRTVIDTIPQEVTVKDADGRYTLANKAAAAARGVRVEELEGVAEPSGPYADGDCDAHALDRAVIETGDPVRLEDEKLVDADGLARTVTTDVVPLSVPEEAGRQALVVTTDTTERVEREERLRRTRSKLQAANRELETERARVRAFLDHAPDGIVVHDAAGEILEVNEAECELLGYERETLRSMNVAEIVPDLSEADIRTMLGYVRDDETIKTRARHQRADGTTYPIEVWVSKFRSRDGEPRFVSLDRDITERLEREEALERTNTVLRTVLDTLPAGVLVEDPNRDILAVNQRLFDLLGVPVEADTLVGEDCATAAHNLKDLFDDPDRFIDRVDELIAARDQVTNEPLKLADGRRLERDYVPYELPDGEANLWVYRDITERAERTAELRETRRQLRRSNEELEQFAYAASHDLKEPLRTVGNYLTLLVELYEEGSTLDARALDLVENAVNATGRMRSMIDALLQYSRIDSRGGSLEPTSLADVVEKARLNLSVRLTDADATVTVDSLPTVHGDSRLLVQLFQNLLDNGVTYNDSANPSVHIGVAPTVDLSTLPDDVAPVDDPSSWYHVYVEDDGIGMDESATDRAFDVFERLGQTDADGTGMGLTLCQRIVEYHDGAIWLTSAPGAGTRVELLLPAATPSST